MSRIAGTSSAAGTAGPEVVENMLGACRTQAGWLSCTASRGRASLGWCGRSPSGLASAGGVLVAVDGNIYSGPQTGNGQIGAAYLASLYQRHGFPEMLSRLNGDFALALYDPETDTLWLGRDRLGIKPLYYAATAEGLAFASRPRALLTLPGLSRQVNGRFVALFAVSHYRYFDNDPESSPYAAIAQLPAAHWLSFHNGRVARGLYWSLQDLPDFTEPATELAERYRALLLDAVRVRLEAAWRPTFTLSGGMDSSSVLAAAVRLGGEKQQAISTVYDDKTYDESHEIGSMLDASVSRWHPIAIGTPDVFDLVRRMVRVHDEPVATATWLSHFLLCERAAREGFGSLFGGMGGDELNAGEYEYFFYHFADLRLRGDERRLDHEVEAWVRHHDHPIFRKSRVVLEDALARLVDFSQPGRCLPDGLRLGRYAAALNPEYFDWTAFEPIMEHPFRSYLKNRTYQDMTRETVPCCLRAEDRQAAAFGLDHFLPFLDYRLVEFMFRVPGGMKIRDGVTKRLLREAMRGLLPEETRTRIKKTGWNAPAHVWFAGAGGRQVLDLVQSQKFRERGIYDGREVRRLLREHEEIVSSGRPAENHMMFFWQLVNLELWQQANETSGGTGPDHRA